MMPPPRFRVVLSGVMEAKVDRWAAWADARGVREDFDKALNTLLFRLAYEADEWGKRENVSDMAGPVAEIRNGVVMMLAVRYGIARPQGLVFVTGLRWRDDYPGGRPPA